MRLVQTRAYNPQTGEELIKTRLMLKNGDLIPVLDSDKELKAYAKAHEIKTPGALASQLLVKDGPYGKYAHLPKIEILGDFEL